ncbi:MAG TPA: response regulator [Planctomycetota bacterium]|nr:response regulator [Planctomycetota bacterium]
MKSILLVEDDPHLLKVLQRVFRPFASEWELTTASDGLQAVDLLQARRFDLIVTDILMPGRDGLETIAAARRVSPQMKIIAMTSEGFFRGAGFLHVAQLLGAHETFAKPFDPEHLLAAIHDLLLSAENESLATGAALPAVVEVERSPTAP